MNEISQFFKRFPLVQLPKKFKEAARQLVEYAEGFH